ncbi:olfactory receptor 4K15-like [Ictidomys tridecemlineatus]|uniref:olfactory receptor 4K15-like n=1 Tax=Ictidomys tridecemlineatus TaxID=43179 RepID=UPI00038BD3CE|nr:olfactory receptor 4K15-like [Ictidomys tridecemlineatus]KAG3261439.1 olfactory receptor 4K15-like [Ictidomys tridecemlineatus]
MDQGNKSRVTEFVLNSLSGSRELQFFYFAFFTVFYLSIVLGNLFILLTIISEPMLYTPMYFLLSNLSFLDVCLSTFATPKMIFDFLMEHKTISFEGCMAQIFFLHVFAGGEMMLLVAMAYDRYVAICRPLHYATIMNVHKCIVLVVGSWIIGVLHSISQLVFTVNLPFCGPNKVDSFFCDLPLVIKLACTDTYILQVLMLSDSGLMAMMSFFLLLISYTVILVTVRRRSSAGMAKARATLTAHITVVTLFFGPCIFIYAWPFSDLPVDKLLSIFYTVFTPLLNPLIYTLRNKEVISAMRKLRNRQISS